jgi:DNA mismatch repair protein MutL
MAATRIRLLPETTANRIAAGEVVERPAAAVKELVENALDAGATRIAVTLEEGGTGRIVVEDDGSGMSPEDLALAVQRHATSKLPEEAALFRIATLGFRGEALPSIGAVARLVLTSCPPAREGAQVVSARDGAPVIPARDGAPVIPARDGAGEGQGGAHAITVEGGRVSAVAPAAGAPGTRVEVRDLFFATPARRAFLKSARSEAEAALDVVRRLALAWPEVAFRVESDGRQVLALPPQDRAARVAALLGPDFAAAALPVEAGRDGIALSGLAAAPTHHRATGEYQHLVVNRRPVRDPQLRAALRVAYRELVPRGRHPAAALFLEIPPEAVDVNVHPMKTELRFRDAEGVRGLLISALRRALAVGVGAVPGLSAAGRRAAEGCAGLRRADGRAGRRALQPRLRFPGLAVGAAAPGRAAPAARLRRACAGARAGGGGRPARPAIGAAPVHLCRRGGAGWRAGAGGPARRA